MTFQFRSRIMTESKDASMELFILLQKVLTSSLEKTQEERLALLTPLVAALHPKPVTLTMESVIIALKDRLGLRFDEAAKAEDLKWWTSLTVPSTTVVNEIVRQLVLSTNDDCFKHGKGGATRYGCIRFTPVDETQIKVTIGYSKGETDLKWTYLDNNWAELLQAVLGKSYNSSSLSIDYDRQSTLAVKAEAKKIDTINALAKQLLTKHPEGGIGCLWLATRGDEVHVQYRYRTQKSA